MTRKLLFLLVLALFAALPAAAQGEEPNAWASYDLNVRAGPGTNYPILGRFAPNTALVVEAHNADLSWLLVHAADQSRRGWVAALYLRYQPGFSAASLPVSEEILTAAAPSAAAPSLPQTGSAAQTLMSLPLVPPISGRAAAIAQGSGNDPHTFIKVGDCNSEYWEFLGPLDAGNYDLGPYSSLQPTIDFFRGSWAGQSLTAHGGFTVLGVLDPMWSQGAEVPE